MFIEENAAKKLSELEKIHWMPLKRVISGSGTLPHVLVNGEEKIMFSSNNYLGLANDVEVIEKTHKVLQEHGLGPGGSRFLCGDLEIIERMEKRLAHFLGVEDVASFPTGYMANMAVFQTLLDPFPPLDNLTEFSSIIFSDEMNHATVVDGCRLSSAKKTIFRHNDFDDLEKKIIESEGNTHKLIVTQSVFSTEGEVSDIPTVIGIAERNHTALMIDDAHGIGILGKQGRGVISHFNMKRAPDIYMASLDKAIGATGGVLGGKGVIIKFVKTASRPVIFSSAMPSVVAGWTISVLDKIESHPYLIDQVMQKTKFVRERFIKLGFSVLGDGKVPVVPLLTGFENTGIKFEQMLFDEGIFTSCFRFPAATLGQSRIRISLMSNHSDDDVIKLVEACEKVGKKLKLI